jgi:hypothetical protein
MRLFTKRGNRRNVTGERNYYLESIFVFSFEGWA